MPATWRQCDICLDWRRDVAIRGHVLDDGALCPHCTRVFGTPTMSEAEHREMAKAPQEGGRDVLARFEKNLGRDLEERGRTRRRSHKRYCDHCADAVPLCHLD